MPDYSSRTNAEMASLLAAQGTKIGDDSVNSKATELAKLLPGSPTVQPRHLPAGTDSEGKVAGFNQSSFKDDVGRNYTSERGYQTQSGVGGQPLGNGYCAGVCLTGYGAC